MATPEELAAQQQARADAIKSGFRGLAKFPANALEFVKRGANQLTSPSYYAPTTQVNNLVRALDPVVGGAAVAGQSTMGFPPEATAEMVRVQKEVNPTADGVFRSTIIPNVAEAVSQVPANIRAARTGTPAYSSMPQSEIDRIAADSPSARQILMKSHPTATTDQTSTPASGGGFAAFTGEPTEDTVQAPSFRRVARDPYVPQYDIGGHGWLATLGGAKAASQYAKGEYNAMANAQKTEDERNAQDLERFRVEQAANVGRMNARAQLMQAKTSAAKGAEPKESEFAYEFPVAGDEFTPAKPGKIKIGKKAIDVSAEQHDAITPETLALTQSAVQDFQQNVGRAPTAEEQADILQRAYTQSFFRRYMSNPTTQGQ